MTVRTERLITFMTPTRAKTTKLYTMPVEASYKALGRANIFRRGISMNVTRAIVVHIDVFDCSMSVTTYRDDLS